jgi:hypothetical protein
MLLHCIDESVELTPEAVADIEQQLQVWLDDTISRGVNLHGARLRPVETATKVSVRADKVIVSDGPFAETKEQIGGYDLIECRDLDEAIRVAAGHPTARIGTIEIRPVVES